MKEQKDIKESEESSKVEESSNEKDNGSFWGSIKKKVTDLVDCCLEG